MIPLLVGLLLLGLMIALGQPVAFALFVSSIIGLLLGPGLDSALGTLAATPYRTSAAFLLTTVPMFLLMASFMDSSGIAPNMYQAARSWVGHLRGGLASATVLASAGFAALTGASVAGSAAMAKIAVPEMTKHGFRDKVALGAVACSGTLAILIPPSIALIIYGLLAEQSIGRLLIGGIIPGLLTAAVYILTVWIWAKLRPADLPRAPKLAMRQRVKSLLPVWPALLIFGAVIGGIYSGAVTAGEAGALGALAAFALVIAYRKLQLWPVLRDTVQVTSMIFTLMVGAMLFGVLLARSRITQNAIEFVSTNDLSPLVVLLAISVMFLILGMFLDPVAIQFLTIPTVAPLMIGVGYDPIWFGVIVIKLIEIGLVTPPLGLNAYITASSANVPVERVFAGVLPFLIADTFVILLLLLMPSLVTWLPNFVG